MKYFNYMLRTLTLISMITFIATSFAGTPDQPGPYKVGYQEYLNVPMPNGLFTNISVWYPTNDTTGTAAVYSTSFYSGYPFTMPSRLGALQKATPISGRRALVVVDHGAGFINRDVGRFQNISYNEHLATYGFIVASYTHHNPYAQKVLEGNAVIEYMTVSSTLSSNIQTNNVGIAGISDGGNMMFGVAASQNPKVKALFGREPVFGINTNDLAVIALPTLTWHTQYLGGQASRISQIIGMNNTTYEIYAKQSDHLTTDIDLCDLVRVNREIAISRGIPEPLAVPNNDPYGSLAYRYWTIGDQGSGIQFGGASEYCIVDNWVPSVDPSLLTYSNRIKLIDEQYKRMKTYYVPFFQIYLDGNTVNANYLTEQYFNVNYSSDDVTLNVIH